MAKVKTIEERAVKLKNIILRPKLLKINDGTPRFVTAVQIAVPEDKVYRRGNSRWMSVTIWNPDFEQFRLVADLIELLDEKAAKLEIELQEYDDIQEPEKASKPANEREYDLSEQ